MHSKGPIRKTTSFKKYKTNIFSNILQNQNSITKQHDGIVLNYNCYKNIKTKQTKRKTFGGSNRKFGGSPFSLA